MDALIDIEIPAEIRELEVKRQGDYYDEVCDELGVQNLSALEGKEWHDAHARVRENEYAGRCQERHQIRPFCYRRGYSDCEPFEVVRIVSENCVEVRALDAKQDPEWVKQMEWHAGGFAGHLANQRAQKWIFARNENNEVFKIRWHKARGCWGLGRYGEYRMCDEPYKFYDYNF